MKGQLQLLKTPKTKRVKSVTKTSDCMYKCRFIPINAVIAICPHTARGVGRNYKGLEEEARATLEKWGGYDAVLADIEREEAAEREARRGPPEPKPALHYK